MRSSAKGTIETTGGTGRFEGAEGLTEYLQSLYRARHLYQLRFRAGPATDGSSFRVLAEWSASEGLSPLARLVPPSPFDSGPGAAVRIACRAGRK